MPPPAAPPPRGRLLRKSLIKLKDWRDARGGGMGAGTGTGWPGQFGGWPGPARATIWIGVDRVGWR